MYEYNILTFAFHHLQKNSNIFDAEVCDPPQALVEICRVCNFEWIILMQLYIIFGRIIRYSNQQ